MKVRVSDTFSLRWQEEWDLARRQCGYSSGAYARALNLFLEQFGPEIARVLKHQLLEALLAETAASQRVPIESSVLDSIIRD